MEGDSPQCVNLYEEYKEKGHQAGVRCSVLHSKGNDCVKSRVALYCNSKVEWFPLIFQTLKAKYGQETDSKQVP